MSKIKILKENVYKKIAAGEVVERPLSVVKELVENSIDAGAREIGVELVEGGKKSIKVKDNGEGFAGEDITLAFKRHSTSKLAELNDLDRIITLGFRGEALPSILEVSRVVLKTSNNTSGAGLQGNFENRKLVSRSDIAFNRGTVIEVKDLFYNFPVRRKFLKSDRTELNKISAFLEQCALVNFDISFSLVNNGKTIFVYNKTPSLKERIYQIFGKDFLDNLQEIRHEDHLLCLQGYVSRLNTGVAQKRHQFFFVNKRPIREKTLFAALNNTFQRYLEKHKNPAAILMLDIPPSEIDVNIHPMKLEIKFKDSSHIYQFLKRAIDNVFSEAGDFPVAEDITGSLADFIGTGRLDNRNSRGRFYDGNVGENKKSAGLFSQGDLQKSDFRVLGQFNHSYIIVEKKAELLIIDQHNAHERINFERLKKEYLNNKVASISPLFPVILELSPSEAQRLDENKQLILQKLGFELSPLSSNSFDIKKSPQLLEERQIKDAIRTIIHLKEEEVNIEDRVISEVACKSSIKVNHKMIPEEMQKLIEDLFNTSNPYFCPHKRPIIIKYSLEEIEKKMKRK